MRIPRYIRLHRWQTNNEFVAVYIKDMAGRYWAAVMRVNEIPDVMITFCPWNAPILPKSNANIPPLSMAGIIRWARSIRWAFTSPIGLTIDEGTEYRRIPYQQIKEDR